MRRPGIVNVRQDARHVDRLWSRWRRTCEDARVPKAHSYSHALNVLSAEARLDGVDTSCCVGGWGWAWVRVGGRGAEGHACEKNVADTAVVSVLAPRARCRVCVSILQIIRCYYNPGRPRVVFFLPILGIRGLGLDRASCSWFLKKNKPASQ